MDQFLHFLVSHNATIIEVLFGLTLLVVLFLSIRLFLAAQDPETAGTAGGMDMDHLESTLKQILERAGQVSSASAAGGGSEESQRLVVEIQNLKTELETKQKQIEEMKSAPAATAEAPPAGMSSEDKAKLENQLTELQAKLAEYEIISEDIADLSFYKEQNVKLQKELDTLKAGGGSPAASATASSAVAKSEPEIVGKSKSQEVVSPAQAAAPPEIPVAPAPPPPVPVPEPEAPKAADVAPAPVEAPKAAAPAAPVADPAANSLVDDDLMAEFAAAVANQKPAPTAPTAQAPASGSEGKPEAAGVDLGQMDMDKMLAEASTINPNAPDVDPEKALGTGVDENKLLQEAAALEGVSQEDKKLMGDFENFVKKSES